MFKIITAEIKQNKTIRQLIKSWLNFELWSSLFIHRIQMNYSKT